MKRFSVVLVLLISVLLLCSCIDYGALAEEEAKQVMAEQKVEQEEKEVLDKISLLEQENEMNLQTIEDITKQNEQLEKDYDTLEKKVEENKSEIKKYEDDLIDTLEGFDELSKFNDFLRDIIIDDNVLNKKLTFEFVDLLSVEYSPENGDSVTFDRVNTEYLKKGFNPFVSFDIEDEDYYNDDNYKNGALKKEKKTVSPNAYICVGDIETYGLEEEVAKNLKQIVEIPEDEVESYSWYIEDKEQATDSDGKKIEVKRIYFVGMIDNEIVIMMERGTK